MPVTNNSIANIPYWGCLPMMYTNYGGDNQMCTIPSYAGYNLGYSFNPTAQQTWGTVGASTASMPTTPQINQEAVVRGAQELLNQKSSQKINTTLSNISMTKSRMQAKLNDKNTTDDQKTQIQELLDKIKEEEDKLKDLAKSTDLDPQTAYQKSSEIESEVNDIVKNAINLLNTGSTTGSTTSTGSTGSTTSTTSTGSTGSTSTTSTGSTGSTTSTTSTHTTQGVSDFDSSVNSAVDAFHDATYRNGTDDDAFNAVCGAISKDNVMDVMLCWNKLHSTEKGESFMDAFMWDADSGQKTKYGKQIARALRDKAEELGVYDQCQQDFAAIDKEMGSWFYVSNDISKNYDNIIRIIAEKMGSPYGSPQSTAKS